MLNFEFKTRPYDHQRKALEDSWAAEYYALFMEMGTGKSKVAIDNIYNLWRLYKFAKIKADHLHQRITNPP